MTTPRERAIQRLRTALELMDAGCEMKRMTLRRQHPDIGEDALSRLVSKWLRDKPVPLAGVPGFRLRKKDA